MSNSRSSWSRHVARSVWSMHPSPCAHTRSLRSHRLLSHRQAEKVYEARVAIAAAPIKTPVTKQGSQAALRAAAHGRNPLSEGSVVQLKGLEDVSGITMNAFDVNLAQYNGRRGRVSKDPPAWVIKAVGAKAGEQGALDKRQEQLGGLVPVLLESKITDVERHRGVWVAVPAANLKVLS